jgi:hypothetical protein
MAEVDPERETAACEVDPERETAAWAD